MYTLTLKTAPTVEPITTAQAISYMRLGTLDTTETAYLTGLIKTAREYCEGFQKRAYITQTWEMSLSCFPSEHTNHLTEYHRSDVIEIPKGSLQRVNSVKYTDSFGATTTLAENADYIVAKRGILGRISPPYGCIWPTTTLYPLDPIVIEFTCGYGDAGTNVPMKAMQSMYMLISYWWDNRVAADTSVPKEVDFAVRALLSMDRIAVI
ncbi:MAG: hypothetical protein VB078_00425 [Clostridiaceae bacterium]|nr:hypothetical protein [Clostridiaceae bacterium]